MVEMAESNRKGPKRICSATFYKDVSCMLSCIQFQSIEKVLSADNHIN